MKVVLVLVLGKRNKLENVFDGFSLSPQVVTLAVYSYFLSCVMGRQWLDPSHLEADVRSKAEQIDIVFPLFTTLQVRCDRTVYYMHCLWIGLVL